MFLRKTENDVRIGSVSHSLLMLIAGGAATLILAAGSARAAPRAQAGLVEFEKMTWVEVKAALAAGKTTGLIYTGGGEERGPPEAHGGPKPITHAGGVGNAGKTRKAIHPPPVPPTPQHAESLPGTHRSTK